MYVDVANRATESRRVEHLSLHSPIPFYPPFFLLFLLLFLSRFPRFRREDVPGPVLDNARRPRTILRREYQTVLRIPFPFLINNAIIFIMFLSSLYECRASGE